MMNAKGTDRYGQHSLFAELLVLQLTRVEFHFDPYWHPCVPSANTPRGCNTPESHKDQKDAKENEPPTLSCISTIKPLYTVVNRIEVVPSRPLH